MCLNSLAPCLGASFRDALQGRLATVFVSQARAKRARCQVQELDESRVSYLDAVDVLLELESF